MLTLAVLPPLVLTAILAGLFLWQISRLLSPSQWVEHTDEVIERANRAQRLLLDMETGVRGYLLTGRQEFLEPYNRATPQLAPALEAMASVGWTRCAPSSRPSSQPKNPCATGGRRHTEFLSERDRGTD